MEKEEDDKKMLEMMDEFLGDLTDNERRMFTQMLTNTIDAVDDSEQESSLKVDWVSEQEWTLTHPRNMKCGSDKFYAALSSEIINYLEVLSRWMHIPMDAVVEIGMSCAVYLEDVVSEIGVWNACRARILKLTGRKLPFYDTDHDDYFDDDVNIEDIRFLVWQSISRVAQRDNGFYDPGCNFVKMAADIVYNLLVDRFDRAPQATRVRNYVKSTFANDTKDFFRVRGLCQWISWYNKLTSAPKEMEYQYAQFYRIKSGEGDTLHGCSLEQERYHYECTMIWQKCGPVGCLPSLYLAEMAREYGFPEAAERLEGVVVRDLQPYKVIGEDKGAVTLNSSTKKELRLDKRSVAFEPDSRGVVASLVRYGNLWHANGIAMMLGAEPFPQSGTVRCYSGDDAEFMEDIVKKHRGRRIYYLAGLEEVQEVLGLPSMSDTKDIVPSNTPIMVFISAENGLSVHYGYNALFKDKANPFYKKQEAEKNAMMAILCMKVPEDIARIIAEKKLLGDASIRAEVGKRYGKAVIRDNMLFLLMFYGTEVHDLEDDGYDEDAAE